MTSTQAQWGAYHPSARDRQVWLAVALLAAVLGWGGVAYIELVRLSKDWVFIYVVSPFEATIWLIAAMATIYLAKVRFLPSVLTRVVAAAAMAVLIVHFNNWSYLQPESYYASHRGSFEQVAELVRAGELGRSDEYYGERLPTRLVDLSVNGRVSAVGEQDGRPVVFLPQWTGIPDDAGGYLYFAGEPRSDLFVDLYGRGVSFADFEELGDGWWYV